MQLLFLFNAVVLKRIWLLILINKYSWPNWEQRKSPDNWKILIMEVRIIEVRLYLLFIHLLPAFLDTCQPRGNVHERHSGPMRGTIPTQYHNPTGVYEPYSFRIVMWVILRPTRTNQGKCCEKGTYGFSSLSEKTRKSKHLQMSLQRQHFLLSYLKTLSVGPAGVRARDLPLSSPALSQLSQTGGSFVLSNLPRASKTRWMHAARLSFLK